MTFIRSASELSGLKIPVDIRGNKASRDNSVLVTGGAGFLGVHLLKKIVESGKFGKVYTIVRDRKKVIRQAESFRLDAKWIEGVDIIEGDLLTLSEDLFPKVGSVVHCAAEIHCLKSLEQLWQNNVVTTARLSGLYVGADFNFISSLSVFVSSNLLGKHQEVSLETNDQYVIYGGYAQSKFVGEKIVERNKQKIIRPGLITGSTITGINPDGFFSSMIKLLKQIGSYPVPYEESFVDVTPVDLASEAICSLLSKNVEIAHIANKKSLGITELVKTLGIVEMPKNDWLKKFNGLTKIEKTLLMFAFFKTEALSLNFDYFNIDLFQSTGHEYSIEESFEFSNEELIRKYLKVLK